MVSPGQGGAIGSSDTLSTNGIDHGNILNLSPETKIRSIRELMDGLNPPFSGDFIAAIGLEHLGSLPLGRRLCVSGSRATTPFTFTAFFSTHNIANREISAPFTEI